jgi:hypothetical protein
MSFVDIVVQAARLDLNVDETPYLIRPLEATEGCMALVLEPYQHRIGSDGGLRIHRSSKHS